MTNSSFVVNMTKKYAPMDIVHSDHTYSKHPVIRLRISRILAYLERSPMDAFTKYQFDIL